MLQSKLFLTDIDGQFAEQIDVGKYPAGEVYIKSFAFSSDEAVITAAIFDSDTVIALLQLVDILDRRGVKRIQLDLAYLPYSRQDRVIPGMSGNESLSLKVFAQLINSCNFTKVTIYDPHSTVSPALFNNVNVIEQTDEFILRAFNDSVDNIMTKNDNVVIVAPDVGAVKRAYNMSNHYNIPNVVLSNKVRNPSTGQIEGAYLYGGAQLQDSAVLVFDDICDGGYTFIELAKSIQKYEPREMHLFVTTGLFTKGLDELTQYYNTVMCRFNFNSSLWHM